MSLALRLPLALAAALVFAAPAHAATAGEDLVDIGTRACFGLLAKQVAWPFDKRGPERLEAERLALGALGLTPGIERADMARLGPGQAMLNQATMAQRKNGVATTIFAIGGGRPGCSAMTIGGIDRAAEKARAVAALEAPGSGWTAVPALSTTQSSVERRVFLRRDANGAPYMLNLMTPTINLADLQIWTTVVPVPPEVELPKGF